MSVCFGIHVGNSSICLAMSREGRNEVIANEAGDRVTPAIAFFDGKNLEVCVPPKTIFRRKHLISNIKRIFSGEITPEEIQLLNDRNECKIKCAENNYYYEVQTEDCVITRTPNDILSKFFGKMFNIATYAASAEGDLQTVVATPPHWSDGDRTRLIETAETVGFNLLHAINEPTAAMLAYNVDESPFYENVIVYRVGGTSCDISLMKSIDGVFGLEKTVRQIGVGGQYITKDLSEYIAAEFYQKYKLDIHENRRAVEKLFQHANDCKHVLSMLNASLIFIESLCDGIDWNQNISRARFENVVLSKLEACVAPLRKFIFELDASIKISRVILCGGTLKIPKLQSMVSSLLPCTILMNSLPPDEVIALGCAKQASLLSNCTHIKLENSFTTVNSIASPIYIKFLDNKLFLFPTGSTCNSRVEYPLDIENLPDKIEVHAYESEAEIPLGSYTFTLNSNASKILAVLYEDDFTLEII